MNTRVHAIAGFVLACLLFSLQHWSGKPVFNPHESASALHFDEAVLYAPGARRFADTGVPAWELDVIELRDERFAYPVTHQIVLGTLARLVGGVERAFVIAHTLFPACVWLGFFGLVVVSTRNAALSSAAAWVAILAAAAPRNAVLLGSQALIQPLEMCRTPHPSLSTLLLLLVLGGLLQCITTRQRAWPWLTGVALGLLFYSYYFHAVAAWTAAGALLLFAWRRMGAAVLTGLVVAAPYFQWTMNSMRSGNSRQLMERIGSFERTPDWLALAGLVVCVFCFFRLRSQLPANDRRRAVMWLLTALLAGACVVANLHLITGYNAQHEHAYNRIIQPFGVLLVALIIPSAAVTRWLPQAAALLLLTLAAVRQVKVAALDPPAAPAALGVLAQQDGELVVGVLDEPTRALLPVLTKHWSFVPMAFRTLASNEEILTRFVIVAKLGGMTKAAALEMIRKLGARSYCYGLLDDVVLKPADAQRFDRIWDSLDPAQALQTRRLDVLVLPEGKIPAGSAFTPLAPGVFKLLR